MVAALCGTTNCWLVLDSLNPLNVSSMAPLHCSIALLRATNSTGAPISPDRRDRNQSAYCATTQIGGKSYYVQLGLWAQLFQNRKILVIGPFFRLSVQPKYVMHRPPKNWHMFFRDCRHLLIPPDYHFARQTQYTHYPPIEIWWRTPQNCLKLR